jgi:single-strand DNA-binding protein
MHIPYYGIIKVEEVMFNNVSLVGRLTDDPVTKESQLGKSYTSFCIAVDRKTKDKEADFFNCTLFGNSGVALNEYAQKGRLLAVSGKVQIDKYTNKDGVKMQAIKVIVDNWSLLDSRKEQNDTTQPVATKVKQVNTDDIDDPFADD